jgi:hypothetical protein
VDFSGQDVYLECTSGSVYLTVGDMERDDDQRWQKERDMPAAQKAKHPPDFSKAQTIAKRKLNPQVAARDGAPAVVHASTMSIPKPTNATDESEPAQSLANGKTDVSDKPIGMHSKDAPARKMPHWCATVATGQHKPIMPKARQKLSVLDLAKYALVPVQSKLGLWLK